MIHIETRMVVNFFDFLLEITQSITTSHKIQYDLSNSNIKYGNNPDTLLDANKVEEFINPYGFKLPKEFENIWFSLGC